MFAWSKRSSHTVVSSCEFVLMEKSTVFLCGRSFFFLSFCVLQESGQMEQMAQTSMLRAGHMMDPCCPVLMTLAKCTCSPSPALNQGSVMLTHSDKHKAHQSRGLRVCMLVLKFVPLRRHADFQHCQNYVAMVFVSQLHCDEVLMNTGETQWKLSRNNRIPYHYQACNVHNVCQVFILCSQTVAGC